MNRFITVRSRADLAGSIAVIALLVLSANWIADTVATIVVGAP